MSRPDWLRGSTGRRLLSCLFLGAVAALITDKGTGSGADPLAEFRRAVLATRAIPWLVAGVVLWFVWTFGRADETSAPILAARRQFANARERARGVLPGGSGPAAQAPRYAGYLALLAFAVLAPRALPVYLQQAAFDDAAIFALLALGLNVVVGYAGLLDLGFIAFFAIGCYSTAYFTVAIHNGVESPHPLPSYPPFHINPWLMLPIAAAIAALAGIILGAPTLRLRGDYLAIVTLGFGEIVQIIAKNANWLGAAQGDFGVPQFSIHVGPINYDFSLDPLPYYYITLIAIVLVMIAFSRLERSRVGRAWAAVREDEVAAAANGVPTLKYKLMAFAIGASTSGLAGVIFATSVSSFTPENFSYQQSILVLTVVIFGGMGNIFGAVIGAASLQMLANYLNHSGVIQPADTLIYFGAIVMIMMVFRPQGLIASRRRRRELALTESGVGGADALGAIPGGAVA